MKRFLAVALLVIGGVVACGSDDGGSGNGGSGGGLCGDFLAKVEQCCNKQATSEEASEFTSECEKALQQMTPQEQAGVREMIGKSCNDFMAEMQAQGYPGCQ